VRYRTHDGGTFIGETVVTAVKNREGCMLGWLRLIRDITDRKHADALVEADLARLAKKHRYEGIVSAVAHSRVLQEGEFERVGGSHTLTVNVRVIAATNRDLATAVQAVSFHADLFYRLNVFPLLLPPLRERKDDIPLLVKCFLARMAKKLRKALTGLSDESMARVMCYSWSGNVGELHNVIERAAILARGPIVEIDDALEQRLPPSDDTLPATSLQDVERAHIIRVLAEAHGIIEGPRGTARILGLHPNMLRFRLQKLGTTHSRRRL
jgi:transcriptional regulator with GAF, ATPase, and Fis domain